MTGIGTKILSLTLLMVSLTAVADSRLLENPTRPRIADTLAEHIGYRPEQNIPLQGGNLNYEGFAQAIEEGAPQFFAKIESAYPGATFAFIGRDTQTIADVVEAIYLTLGQKNRVEQLGVSKPTMENLNDAQIVKYLENFGFKLSEALDRPPFIMVDTISRGEAVATKNGQMLISGRQGRRILQAVYSEWAKMGHDPKKLLGKFNLIGLQVSTYRSNDPSNKYRYINISKIKSAQATNAQRLSDPNFSGEYGYEMQVPLIPDTQRIFNESGYDHFTGAWHDRYQPPTAVPDGRLKPRPGVLTNAQYRKSIIWLQHEIIHIVNMKSFRDQVMSEAANHGVNVDLKQRPKIRSCRTVYQ